MLHAAEPGFRPGRSRYTVSSASAADLIAGARRALDHDLHVARRYLDELAAMLSDEDGVAADEAILLPATPESAPFSGPVRGGLAAWQLRRVVQHVDTHLGGTIVLEMLADVARLSTGHFCRAFKVTMGETPHAFLIRQRVRRAQMLMLQTDDTLSQIACACGLTDQAHLTRLFRRMLGETPLVWRRTWQRVP